MLLTAKQHQAYRYICDFIEKYGYAPTDAEIATGIGIRSRGVAHRYVRALCDAGLIDVVVGKRRNIRLLNGQNSLVVRGTIAAGKPLELFEDATELDLPGQILGRERFLLQVRGDSMIGDNICDGDYIICEHTANLSSQDIVVAVIDNQETTLKRIVDNQDGTVTLLASNPGIMPQIFGSDRASIQARYIGLVRLP